VRRESGSRWGAWHVGTRGCECEDLGEGALLNEVEYTMQIDVLKSLIGS
jgi:hypothetical protein